MTKAKVNNDIYHEYGSQWYTAEDDPVALLRAQGRLLSSWLSDDVIPKIRKENGPVRILDMGCGAGLISNAVGEKLQSQDVFVGVDISEESLKIARNFDSTKKIQYQVGDVTKLPDGLGTFDLVYSMDVLEHVEDPEALVREASRSLRSGGIFIAHTFNRNALAHFVVIKGVEWFVKNTPKDLHVIHLFLKPSETKEFCEKNGLTVTSIRGFGPKVMTVAFWKMLFTRTVSKSFRFEFKKSTAISYVITASKNL